MGATDAVLNDPGISTKTKWIIMIVFLILLVVLILIIYFILKALQPPLICPLDSAGQPICSDWTLLFAAVIGAFLVILFPFMSTRMFYR